ncbi:hypothetical protein Taro_006060 [Colocasia esculenta]|uniref:Uncharacterized protein n=1 Tax=Colocasia esculenta TaxID=4460 RepID=A0A843TZL6_COLES|nr:hypothetical protein [Colocasia esculenta]
MEAAEAQPASGLRRRHRPCRLQEGDIYPVALPVRRRHRLVGGSGHSSSGNLPETGKTLHTGEGSMLIMLESH